MLTHPTLEKLKELKLHGMVKVFEEQLSSPDYKELSFEERLGIMVEREIIERENRRLESRLKKAKLRHQACMEDIDYVHPRKLDKSLMRSFSTCNWIRERLNMIITGPTGVGKSYIGCALAHRACMEGYSALYFRAPRLFQELAVAKGDGRYAKLMNSIAKSDLIVIDDWGFAPLSEAEQRDFLEILDDRHGIHSTIILGQMTVDVWHKIISNPTLADAILDRLVHNAYKMDLDGDSMRKIKSKLT